MQRQSEKPVPSVQISTYGSVTKSKIKPSIKSCVHISRNILVLDSTNLGAPQAESRISSAISNDDFIDTLSIMPATPGCLHFAIQHDEKI